MRLWLAALLLLATPVAAQDKPPSMDACAKGIPIPPGFLRAVMLGDADATGPRWVIMLNPEGKWILILQTEGGLVCQVDAGDKLDKSKLLIAKPKPGDPA